MAPRQAGAEVSVYLEHLEKWVDGIVEGYIKGFGYEASVILEDQVISGNKSYLVKGSFCVISYFRHF
jgi:hypothetical protein